MTRRGAPAYERLFDKAYLETRYPSVSGRLLRYVHLDSAATTPPFRAVQEAVEDFLREYGSIHRGAGRKSQLSSERYEAARARIRRFVGAGDSTYVIFSKNTTEAINHAASFFSEEPGHILVSRAEHSSNLLPWVLRERDAGREALFYDFAPAGTAEPGAVEEAFRAARRRGRRIKLLTVTAASNLLGYPNPVHELAAVAHRHGARIFVDCCQWIQHGRVDVLAPSDPRHLDFIAFSGHKMYAPYGTGCLLGPKSFFDAKMPRHIGGANLLYISADMEISRMSSEQAHDPGTPNPVGAVAIARAMDVLEQVGLANVRAHEQRCAKTAYDLLAAARLPLRFYVERDRVRNLVTFDLEGMESRAVAQALDAEACIGVRGGAFCMYDLVRRLKGIGPEQDRRLSAETRRGRTGHIPGVVRASFSLLNGEDDARRLADALAALCRRSRR